MSITVTEQAAQQIQKQLQKRGNGLGLRLAVKKAGCSGYSYALDYADQIQADDSVFESQTVKILVDSASLPLVNGLQLDYRREGINAAFQFSNPNVSATCGCGESFAV